MNLSSSASLSALGTGLDLCFKYFNVRWKHPAPHTTDFSTALHSARMMISLGTNPS